MAGRAKGDDAPSSSLVIVTGAIVLAPNRPRGLRRPKSVPQGANPRIEVGKVTRRAIAAQDGPTILVGHSYGGAVISESGNDPKVKGLVYIAAFALDAGESAPSLMANPPPGAPVPPILPPQDGFLLLDHEKFAASFAADVKPAQAAFMANSRVPWASPR